MKAAVQIRLEVPLASGTGHYCQDMYFDADDPLGTWGFELLANGKSIKSWQIPVYQP